MTTESEAIVVHGGCLCGAIQFDVAGPVRSVVACHCRQCRKSSGHFVAATQVANRGLTIRGGNQLTWFASSEQAERGFCSICGSQLFWREHRTDFTSIMAGSLDGQTGLTMDRQLHVDAKGDYYPAPDVPIIDQSTL